eukprot:13543151-Alexandrium_andersonii.AAC.1
MCIRDRPLALQDSPVPQQPPRRRRSGCPGAHRDLRRGVARVFGLQLPPLLGRHQVRSLARLCNEEMQIVGLAARALARIVTQGGVPVARVVGGAEPPSRPTTQTARGRLSHRATRTRHGARPNTRTARAARLAGLAVRSHTQATHESRPGELGVLEGLGIQLIVGAPGGLGAQLVVGVLGALGAQQEVL